MFPIDKFKNLRTPFYYYDTRLLRETLRIINAEVHPSPLSPLTPHPWEVHYAVKANANPALLRIISQEGFGADCVSGGEIEAALEAGFPPSKIVYAGVGKADWEINLALQNDIFCFNVESLAELEVINQLAAAQGKVARIALRINPDVGAHTHANITTGLAENKFGIAMSDMLPAIEQSRHMSNVQLEGLHFHIGSQILDMGDFKALCNRAGDLLQQLQRHRIAVRHINVGGGLGISYTHPDRQPMADFHSYFRTFARHLHLQSGQTLHFELGRAVVAQCGTLVSRVLYVKQGMRKQFAILDAGMTELIRPALYQASHRIQNLTSQEPVETYDVVGPICESSDVFGKAIDLNRCRRGDLIAIRSAGAYGQSMASQYNCRPLPKAYLTEEL